MIWKESIQRQEEKRSKVMSINRVIVIGGGPAGMMAAAAAGSRGQLTFAGEKMKTGKKLY